MHYVMSDIHGQYEQYLKMLRLIQFSEEDELYVVGDVIDRGPSPINVLMDIISKKNIHLLIGNHEDMMLNAMNDPAEVYLWYKNGSYSTEEGLSKYSVTARNIIKDYLYECPLIIPDLNINGKNYYLAHACHMDSYIDKPLIYKDTSKEDINTIVWSREYKWCDRQELALKYHNLYAMYKNTTLIIGHTPTKRCSYGIVTASGESRISKSCNGHLINVDCNCAGGGNLGCIRLEDEKEFYT